MENKKIIKIILIVFVLIVFLVFIIIKSKDKSIKNDEMIISKNEFKLNFSFEEELKNGFDKAKENFVKLNEKDLNACFKENNINQYLERGCIEYLYDLYIFDIEGVKVYSKEYQELDKDSFKLDYDKDFYDIKADKKYIIKYDLYNSEEKYYYSVKYDSDGNYYLNFEFYTVGE